MSIENKITAPIIWYSNSKFKIIDLRENHYDEVLTLTKVREHLPFIVKINEALFLCYREEPMCKSIELLHDSSSVTGYLNLIKTWMKDTCSLVAVSVKSGRVVGAIITRINSSIERSNTYSRVQVFEGKCLTAIMNLKNSLILQADAYKTFGHNTYLRIYVICVHPSYKSKDVGSALLRTCNLVALNMQIPVVAGIFTSNEHQQIAMHTGYSRISEIFYTNWIIDEKVIFDNPGIGNFSAAFMYITVLETTIN